MTSPAFPPKGQALGLALVFLLVSVGCGALTSRGCRPSSPAEVYYGRNLDSLGTGAALSWSLPASARHPGVPNAPPVSPPAPPADKVDERVRDAIAAAVAAGDPHRIETVVVTFRDLLADRFRAKELSALRPDSASGLRGVRLRNALAAARDSAYVANLAGLDSVISGAPLRRYWLVQAMLVQIQLSNVDWLAARTDVVHVELLQGTEPPQPGPCGTPNETVRVAGERTGIGLYRDAGHGAGRVALLDTGILETHDLLVHVPLGGRFECTDPNQDCYATTTSFDAHDTGHGTASAALLVGEMLDQPEHRGLTDASLDIYRVYNTQNGKGVLNSDGAIKAIEHAVESGHDVVVAEFTMASHGAAAQAAYYAFLGGALIVAANGNVAGKFYGPASSPLAVGVGAYCIFNNRTGSSFSSGRTTDQRIKPDVTAPTSIYTACSAQGSLQPSSYAGFGATSGSTPVAAAATRVLGSWLGASGTPGLMLTALLLCGQKQGMDLVEGAGPIRLPVGGSIFWGVTPMKSGEEVLVPVPVAHASAGLDAVLWWPEFDIGNGGLPLAANRANIDLALRSPAGEEQGSADPGSVTERARMSWPTDSPSTWSLVIRAPWVPGVETRYVHWMAWARPAIQPAP